jgi:nucleotidyltransferase substrate binding protein (TIGR01987 family)
MDNQDGFNELKTIRWQQRFKNLDKASSQLARGLAIEQPSEIERQGIIQSFEFTFELSWKTLKDYLEAQGVICQFPREVIKKAFQHQIIPNGEIWLDMLGKRNLLAHTYDENLAMEAYRLIKQHFAPEIKKLVQWFRERNG